MTTGERKKGVATAHLSANARRANDIVSEVQEKCCRSHFLCPDAIDPYEKQVQRPTFNGKLDISWVKEQR